MFPFEEDSVTSVGDAVAHLIAEGMLRFWGRPKSAVSRSEMIEV